MKYLVISILLVASALSALTTEEIRWLLDKEQWDLLSRNQGQVEALLEGGREELELALEYAQRTKNQSLALRCHDKLALQHHSLSDALEWLQLSENSDLDSLAVAEVVRQLQQEFSYPQDKIVLDYFLYGTPEEAYLEQIRQLRGYNSFIEDLAKSWIDEISVEPSDSLALAMIGRFEHYFPLSQWAQVGFYYRLFHLARAGDYEILDRLITEQGNRNSAYQYIAALFLISPSYRRARPETENLDILERAARFLQDADKNADQAAGIQVLYDLYTPPQWANRVKLMLVKAGYYRLLAEYGLYGDEAELMALFEKPYAHARQLTVMLGAIEFADNDRGDLAELHYWRGRVRALYSDRKSLLAAAGSYVTSLVHGSPRKKYDEACLQALAQLHARLKVKTPLSDWPRKLMKYKGIVFAEQPWEERRYTRIAIGDYDNDGWPDLLFNGNALYRNTHDLSFSPVSDSAGVADLISNGGLWADFNRDGLLDFATISHNADSLGEALMKNMDGTRFVKVNERAGDIDDTFPTEGAAWIDTDRDGYPSFYAANYEKWQQRSGYPDFFWHNDQGYFSDASETLGFRKPDYTDDPGLAGRGVAPADFDNDGHQEILVTNYRLNRNFCWKKLGEGYIDQAALYGLAGKYKDGYYGHSIGADWGDYDNDGDLDLFVANLAHPRYIELSDVSQLLRNDGLQHRVIGSESVWYWQFTDVTRMAGITYDELHSDPLWLDADNDGDLDLFITSVYENDRSYFYRNNGDGTFTDITFLAGARVYNGWGNASADLDRDGLPDLVVGSGNGARILVNHTLTSNRALYVKPVWKSGQVVLIREPSEYPLFPNSPAFGTRVRLTLQEKGQTRTLIRELSSAKGTSSQSAQELHFGLGRGKLISLEKIDYAQIQD